MSKKTKKTEPEIVKNNGPKIAPQTNSDLAVFDSTMFDHMQRIATGMARASLVPEHLVGQTAEETQGNCLLIVEQAHRWQMSPFALARHAYVLAGKLGFEGKVIAAVINTSGRLEQSLTYDYEGSGDNRAVTVTGLLKGERQPRIIHGDVQSWKTYEKDGHTVKSNWRTNADQMLAYRGAAMWARRYAPELVLGIVADDELGMIDRGDLLPGADGVYRTVPLASETHNDQSGEKNDGQFELVDVDGEVTIFSQSWVFAKALEIDLRAAAKLQEGILADQFDLNWTQPGVRELLSTCKRTDLADYIELLMKDLSDDLGLGQADDPERKDWIAP